MLSQDQEQGKDVLTHHSYIILQVLANVIRQERHTYWDGRSKVGFVFIDSMIVYVKKKSKESAENHPRNSDYSNTVDKVNIQNSITFLYICNEQWEFEIKA